MLPLDLREPFKNTTDQLVESGILTPWSFPVWPSVNEFPEQTSCSIPELEDNLLQFHGSKFFRVLELRDSLLQLLLNDISYVLNTASTSIGLRFYSSITVFRLRCFRTQSMPLYLILVLLLPIEMTSWYLHSPRSYMNNVCFCLLSDFEIISVQLILKIVYFQP